MITVKKLVFAVPFLGFFAFFIYQTNSVLKSDLVFNFSVETLLTLVIYLIILGLVSLLFILFAALANTPYITLPVASLAAVLPMFFLDSPVNIIFVVGSFIVFVIASLIMEQKIKSYLDFRPFSLFPPPTKTLGTLLIFVVCIAYFFVTNKQITEKGFQIPDNLIDAAINMATPKGAEIEAPQPSETENLLDDAKENIETIKQNREALEKMGFNTKIIDSLEKAASSSNSSSQTTNQELVKELAKEQFNAAIEPYKSYIPLTLTALFFVSLQSLFSLLAILLGPIFWMSFILLEQTKFITYTTESREVKKLVV